MAFRQTLWFYPISVIFWLTSTYASHWVAQWYCNECNNVKTLNVCISGSNISDWLLVYRVCTACH